ncbi:hypothetical protein [Streptomyces coffeae]|uniref:Secreted protein n=1 Tax=Streptomyces coffeae TaxID=621382 RepID=A0ABS1NE35_9ACTN|nr:hypothetical protein [Streptomyces coffeae]MBL1098343.1 hypothetical protein [Streptomyces coffeae]
MSIRQCVATAAAALAFGAGGLLVTAGPASASTSAVYTCNPPTYMTGSGGHAGASLQCFGTSSNDLFNVAVTCRKPDGYEYRHDGPIVRSGETSTVWCDLNARIVHLAYVRW